MDQTVGAGEGMCCGGGNSRGEVYGGGKETCNNLNNTELNLKPSHSKRHNQNKAKPYKC